MKPCNSPCFTQLAAFFIDLRAEWSTVQRFFFFFISSLQQDAFFAFEKEDTHQLHKNCKAYKHKQQNLLRCPSELKWQDSFFSDCQATRESVQGLLYSPSSPWWAVTTPSTESSIFNFFLCGLCTHFTHKTFPYPQGDHQRRGYWWKLLASWPTFRFQSAAMDFLSSVFRLLLTK